MKTRGHNYQSSQDIKECSPLIHLWQVVFSVRNMFSGKAAKKACPAGLQKEIILASYLAICKQ